jgi:hypothetical protein
MHARIESSWILFFRCPSYERQLHRRWHWLQCRQRTLLCSSCFFGMQLNACDSTTDLQWSFPSDDHVNYVRMSFILFEIDDISMSRCLQPLQPAPWPTVCHIKSPSVAVALLTAVQHHSVLCSPAWSSWHSRRPWSEHLTSRSSW